MKMTKTWKEKRERRRKKKKSQLELQSPFTRRCPKKVRKTSVFCLLYTVLDACMCT